MSDQCLTTIPRPHVESVPTLEETTQAERFPGTRQNNGKHLLPMRELATDIRRLSEISESKATTSVARQWLVLGLCIGGFIALSPHLSWMAWIPCYLAVIGVVATRQHAFLGLIHEAAHYRLLKNRASNDFLSDVFCAFPVGMCTDVYRRLHLLHHQYTNTDQDPDWVGMHRQEDWHWPKDHLSTARLFLLDLAGLAAHKILILLFFWSPLQAIVNRHVSLSSAERLRFVAFLLVTATLFTLFHGWMWFLLLWVVPMGTIFGALVRLRAIAEHLVCPSENELNESRHVEATWFERLTLAPFNVNYHLAHHLFPSVPWYNLPKLQARLEKLEVFQHHAKVTRSYLGMREGVLCEILKPAGGQLR
jgi:fatty acid desaturase